MAHEPDNSLENDMAGPSTGIDPKLLEILVCPLSKAPLEYDAVRQELISRVARLAYPIREGIPIMLPDEARRIDDRPLLEHIPGDQK